MFDNVIYLSTYIITSFPLHSNKEWVPICSTSSPTFSIVSENMSVNNETSPLNIAQSNLDKIDMTVVDQQMYISVVLLKKD